MPRQAPFILISCAFLACDQGAGRLHGDWLVAMDCKRIGEEKRFEPFDMSLDFASVNEQLGFAILRMSPSARSIDKADQLVITIDGVDTLRERLAGEGAPIPLQADGQGEADLTLTLLGRCTHTTQALAAVGTLTFFDYGWKDGARIRGEMRFDLVDRRSGAIVGQGFAGDFDFESKTGSPHTAFSPKDY